MGEDARVSGLELANTSRTRELIMVSSRVRPISRFCGGDTQGQGLNLREDEARRFRVLKNRLCLQNGYGGEPCQLRIRHFEPGQLEVCTLARLGADCQEGITRVGRDLQPQTIMKELGSFSVCLPRGDFA